VPRGEGAGAASVLPLENMTSRQLIRRAKLIEAVIDLIGDVGPDAVQMRDVAQRSGVALATAYRYFRSKEQLLGAALEDWQERLTRRTLSASRSSRQDPLAGLLEYLRRAQRAFARNPEMTALMLQMMTSTDPDIGSTLDRMNQTNTEMFGLLLQGFPTEDIPNLTFALNATLTSAITGVLTGRLSLDESQERVEWAARALLGQAEARRQASSRSAAL
jgi:TetR/AcrR family transcriptional regulator, cholesterol catabolism regulator